MEMLGRGHESYAFVYPKARRRYHGKGDGYLLQGVMLALAAPFFGACRAYTSRSKAARGVLSPVRASPAGSLRLIVVCESRHIRPDPS